MSEFDLIQRYFSRLTRPRADVPLGVGDDAALLEPAPGKQLAFSMDTLVSGVHFLPDVDGSDIGYKSLAVNLSDMAAMGAEPAWASLSLCLPREDDAWLAGFAAGFEELAKAHQVQLVGGDTTRGPLTISVHISGYLEPGQALLRGGARPGDRIYVSGSLGDAGLGLAQALGQVSESLPYCERRLHRPEPRVDLGRQLLGLSRCAIDISDGLLADLGHICNQSDCGAEIRLAQIPLSDELRHYYRDQVDWDLVLASGDDYELCFTVAPADEDTLLQKLQAQAVPVTCVGEITSTPGIRCSLPDGSSFRPGSVGYEHFRE